MLIPCIPEPHTELSPHAPKIIQTKIPVDKIREVIGQGGKVINRIIELTGVEIDIEDDGRVFIASPNSEAADKAMAIINGIAKDPEVGSVFDGVVTRLMTFGAFVEFLPGKEGLVHISKMAWNRVDKVEDVVKEGDPVKVMVTEVDSQGRINLSMRDVMEKPAGYVEGSDRGGDRGPRGGSDRGDRSDRGPRERGGNRGDRGPRGGGDRGPRGGVDRGPRDGGDRSPRGGSDNNDRPPRNNDEFIQRLPDDRNERSF